MEITVELIREAGMRLPAPLGPAIGIVGGLVIGSAVVEAGIVSNVMIIVVAITALAAYSVPAPEMNNTLRVLRFPLMFMAAFMGLLGVTIGVCLILIHLSQLESFDTPYLAPFSTLQWKDMRDTFVRVAIFKQNTRPNETQPLNKKRESYSRGWKKDGV
jgi:spore germination protein KA